jgi:hypothetical protein
MLSNFLDISLEEISMFFFTKDKVSNKLQELKNLRYIIIEIY